MTPLSKILSAGAAAACLATPLAAAAHPDFHHGGVHHEGWRGDGWHERGGRERVWVRDGWRDGGWRESGWRHRGWGPAFYGMPAPVIYDAPDYDVDYAPGPVIYERPIAEERVYERPAPRIVRVVHHPVVRRAVARHTVHRAAHRAVVCAAPTHKR